MVLAVEGALVWVVGGRARVGSLDGREEIRIELCMRFSDEFRDFRRRRLPMKISDLQGYICFVCEAGCRMI